MADRKLVVGVKELGANRQTEGRGIINMKEAKEEVYIVTKLKRLNTNTLKMHKEYRI